VQIQQKSDKAVQIESLDGFPSEIVIVLLVRQLGGTARILFEDEEKFDPDTILGMDFDDTSLTLTLKEPSNDVS
jgi:hypothetical protein